MKAVLSDVQFEFDERPSFQIHYESSHMLNSRSSQSAIPSFQSHHCEDCSLSFETQKDLDNHLSNENSYRCDMCNFVGKSITFMEKHILDCHVKANSNNLFACDECGQEFASKNLLWNHFTSCHKSPNSSKGCTEDEVKNLKSQIKHLTNSFQRLEGILKDTIDEAEESKSQYEAKLLEADDIIRVAKTENEELKERLNILESKLY